MKKSVLITCCPKCFKDKDGNDCAMLTTKPSKVVYLFNFKLCKECKP